MLPLHIAILQKSAAVVKLVYDAYPEADAKDIHSMFALHYAAQYNANPEVFKILLNLNPKSAKSMDNYGRFPLHIAARNKNQEVVKLIFDANPEAAKVKDRDGKLPLHIAAEWNKNPEVEKLF